MTLPAHLKKMTASRQVVEKAKKKHGRKSLAFPTPTGCDKYLFVVENRHTSAHGLAKSPTFHDNDPARCTSFFQDEFGEQAVFVYDHKERNSTLYLGIQQWQPIRLYHAVPSSLKHPLHESQALWLQACWRAARATFGGKR